MTGRPTVNAAAFAPEALRRASPKLASTDIERKREHAETAVRQAHRKQLPALSLSKGESCLDSL
jgi:glutaredoxin